jgi:hypothetical protein
MTDISGPEVAVATTRARVSMMQAAGALLITSPDFEVTSWVDSGDPAHQEWSPDWDAVSRILHGIPAGMTRLTIRFDRL